MSEKNVFYVDIDAVLGGRDTIHARWFALEWRMRGLWLFMCFTASEKDAMYLTFRIFNSQSTLESMDIGAFCQDVAKK
jgi:hypothetical protein